MASNSGNSNPKSKVHQAKGQASNPTAADHQLPEGGDENQYFYEDEVFCIDGKGRVKFGVVLEVEFSEGEEGFEEDALKKGEIRACWHPDGQIEVVKQCKVSGDGLRAMADPVVVVVPLCTTHYGYETNLLLMSVLTPLLPLPPPESNII